MLAANQPRIVTANAMHPQEWHPLLPRNLYTTSDAARVAMEPDIKAIAKRIAWAYVGVSLTSPELCYAYHRRL